MHRILAALERARRDAASAPPWPHEQTGARTGAAFTSAAFTGTAAPATTDSKRYAHHLAAQRIISAGQDDAAADVYRVLRAQVLARMRAQQHVSLAITGIEPGAGASHTAANLAVSLAMDPQNSVLLIDCDLRQPRVHELFATPAAPGLSDYFLHGTPISKLIVQPPIERLAILPAGAPVQNAPELLGSQQMQQMIRTLKAQQPARLMIFDLPPLLHYADAVAFAPLADAVLLVVEERKTRSDQTAQAGELLAGANLIGSVLNKSHSARAGLFARR